MNKIPLIFLILSLFVFAACEREDPNKMGMDAVCDQFFYSDTIFYINETLENKILPVQNLNGLYTSIPEGLALDSLTGEIDINASETGLRYKVTFTPDNSSQNCDFEIIISGINYLDKVYVIDQNEILAVPIFNADQTSFSPCPEDDDDDDDEEGGCDFDEEGPNGLDLSDIGIEVISSPGVIDLERTLSNDAFGINPANGTTIDAVMYYRLDDKSLRALNSIGLKFFYFETLADVPQSLLDEIEEKNNQILAVEDFGIHHNARMARDNPRVKPRPPYLIIVARLQ